ncbi:5-hydroxytryptamine receptor 3A-like [Cynoglossus semilaevis]|uniref:5-hydroxytryptamine receptor 3A-like n=1 Tax=Cynoglossus semilaevis TaxID=244447 RepID=A0A3P8WZ74_CYNSE|nr:5-hydroxytryptamine receptor 3A-like [Cynoglossus semilaevis]XP_016896341.1 5-hydroxytryptamine receptor 3A-like [Cynoglossus semilaevis]
MLSPRQTDMWRWTTVAVLALMAQEGIDCQPSNCSYLHLLDHLNLTSESSKAQSMTRPVKHWRTQTDVLLDMLLYGILNMDGKSQTVTSHVWLRLSWTNEFLTWNPSDFCGIDLVAIPTSDLWIPDIAILEDVSDSGSVQRSPLSTLHPSGLVLAEKRQRLTTTCRLDLYMFPFDKQICNITFSSVNYNEHELKLGTWRGGAFLTSVSEKLMITEGEWQLVNMSILVSSVGNDNSSVSKLIYMVTISRKPLLYIINLIVPLLFFLLLDVASFLIRGDRLSFKLTILLSISVLLLILQDMLPSTEETLPLIANYCVTVFTLVGISILEAMLVNFLLSVDVCCAKRTSAKSAESQLEIQMDVKSHTEHGGATKKVQTKLSRIQDEHQLLKLILTEVKATRKQTEREAKEGKKVGRFAKLAAIIDTVYFILYLIAFVVYIVCMYYEWVNTYFSMK